MSSVPADSAGRPWAGREFERNAWSDDDGSTPPAYAEAVDAFHAGRADAAAVVDALRGVRLLVPLVADLGEAGTDAHGRVHDKRAELALPTVAGPDGRAVLPAFSSAASMALWRPGARPVPAPARQVALGAASDGTELVIVDPRSPTRFGLRRSAVEALARDLRWTPPWEDPDVLGAVRAAAEAEVEVGVARVAAGDPRCTLERPELEVQLALADDLDRDDLQALLTRIRERWTTDALIAARVDSFALRLAPFC